ncbi:hypothetical protein [Pararhizobium sp.]|uniref:hypothetical protein n=1 Tax=Pararhizobium sp. TaxID=1977563 RepID=UPI002719B009|nr:hypothetical protein [Pararhizobium sp.]MDO9414664.1 hypothetical protein [Pararhizobium sp.]
MIWLVAACVALGIVYLARGAKTAGDLLIPALSLVVAAALFAAFIVWLSEDSGRTGKPQAEPQSSSSITPEQLVLVDPRIVQGTPKTAYHVTGTIRNDSAAVLDYFTLAVTMKDCPEGACTVLGDDTALILIRVAPGQTQVFRTTLTFPDQTLSPPKALTWDFRIENVRAAR